MSTNKEFFTAQRCILYGFIFLAFWGYYKWQNHQKQQVKETEAIYSQMANSTPKEFPGIEVDRNPNDKDIRALAAIGAAAVASDKVPVADIPAPTFKQDMGADEQADMETVYDLIWLDTEKRTGIAHTKIHIEDQYRLDPEYNPYGMNNYESHVIINGRCEIVSYSINYQNAQQFRITGNRTCV